MRNQTIPESVLKKNHNYVAYDWIWEVLIARSIKVAKECGATTQSGAIRALIDGV